MTLDDPRWAGLKGAYRTPFDPRPNIIALTAAPTDEDIWKLLWDELYHQGDVDHASYATVIQIANVLEQQNPLPVHAYWLVAAIETARQNPYEKQVAREPNPAIPDWMSGSYFDALQKMIALALRDFQISNDSNLKRGVISLLAASSQLPVLADLCFLEEQELLSR